MANNNTKTTIRTEKNDKRKRIYSYVYTHKIATRPEIAAALNVSLPTANQYVQELVDEGLLEDVGSIDSGVGRKPVALRCKPTAKLAVGISLTPHHISGVLVDLFGQVLQSRRIYAVFEDSPEYRVQLASVVEELVSQQQAETESLLGVMISVPGAVSTDSNEISFSHVFPIGLKCESLTEHIPYKCSFCNDATAAGFTELWNSAPHPAMAYLSLNETVGGSIMFDRRIYSGDNNRSGEFGHMSIARDGPLCQCGKRGCMNCFCSGSVLARNYEGNLDEFFLALKQGDKPAVADFDEFLSYLALGVDAIRSMLDCDIVIGGDIAEHIEPYMDSLRQRVKMRNSFGDNSDFIFASRNKRMASATGAALLLIPSDISSLADGCR